MPMPWESGKAFRETALPLSHSTATTAGAPALLDVKITIWYYLVYDEFAILCLDIGGHFRLLSNQKSFQLRRLAIITSMM